MLNSKEIHKYHCQCIRLAVLEGCGVSHGGVHAVLGVASGGEDEVVAVLQYELRLLLLGGDAADKLIYLAAPEVEPPVDEDNPSVEPPTDNDDEEVTEPGEEEEEEITEPDEEEEEVEEVVTYRPDDRSPVTGDDFNDKLIVALIIASIICMSLCLIVDKKKKEEE